VPGLWLFNKPFNPKNPPAGLTLSDIGSNKSISPETVFALGLGKLEIILGPV